MYLHFPIIDIISSHHRRTISHFINTVNVFYNNVFLLKLFSFLCCHNVKYNICFYQHTTKIYSKLSETGNTLRLRLTFTFIWYCCLLDVYKYKINFCSNVRIYKCIQGTRTYCISFNINIIFSKVSCVFSSIDIVHVLNAYRVAHLVTTTFLFNYMPIFIICIQKTLGEMITFALQTWIC